MKTSFHDLSSHAVRLKCAVLASLMVLTCALSGCGSSGSSSDAAAQSGGASGGAAKDTLVIAKDEDVTSLDPQAIVNEKSFSVYCNLYEGLVRYNSTTHKVEPCLATDWKEVDDTTYHFNLRKGVKFHDGNTMTAQDVVFSFNRAMKSGVVSTYMSFIKSVEADGDYAVTMHTKVPYSQILLALTNPSAAIVSKAAVEKYGDDFAKHPVGTGPYKLTEWKAADSISMTAFSDYWDKPAKTKNLVFKVIPEGSQRTIMLENGEVDIASAVLPNDASRVKENKDLTLIHDTGYKCMILYFKCNSATPTKSNLVRQAFQYAINKTQIVDSVVSGYGKVGSLYSTPLTAGYSADKDQGDLYNPEKAKSLLKQAGYPNGFSLDLYCSSDQTYQEIATILKSQLAEVGINLNVKVMESNTINEKVYSGEEVPIRMAFYNNLCGDTDLVMQKLLPSAYGQVYFNDKVETLMNQARGESDVTKRQEVYDQFWDMMADDMPWLTIYYEESITGLSNKVHGFVLNPVGATMYNNVVVDG